MKNSTPPETNLQSNFVARNSMESRRNDHIPVEMKPSRLFDIGNCDTEQEQGMPFFRSFSKNREITWVISLFVLLHLVAFATTMFANNCWRNSQGDCALKFLGRMSFQPLSENPLLGPSASTLDEMGALRQKFLAHDHQIWRLFTCFWLHAGVFHLIINLTSVIFVGIQLEQKFGPLRIGIIYILSALTGTLMAALFIQNSPAVSSSAALFGLIGSLLSGLIRNWELYTDKILVLVSLSFISSINFVVGLLPYVDNFANIGGSISGFLLGFVLFFPPQIVKESSSKGLFDYGRRKSSAALKRKLDRPILRSIALVLFCLTVAIVLLPVLHGINVSKYCSWCQYINCVPSKSWNCEIRANSCKETISGGKLTLTCVDNDNFKVFPFTAISPARRMDLCALLCS
ncbi:hypothetical protein Nepgr_033183 [Nepenthes gracilis]|uniref:RHOMBOID-like protein n=1 Tax=Nepenthes gracilis TaxID=150966 RepID=A0AAD3TK24_NEPGR|nr:hypothetical protein Nepgr_033183 [Nepenthes gracilis]